MNLDGKTALVTGASRGIGEASAKALAAAGARVLLSGRTVSDLQRVAAEMDNDPLILEADLSLPCSGTVLADRVIAETGGVDILVNNAGIPMRRTPANLTEEDVDLVFSINVFHNLYLYDLKSAIEEMVRVGRDKFYICAESYRNEEEKANLLYWQLTCEIFFTPKEWLWFFEQCGYQGDYDFIYFT